jgi:hypothetical protein
MDNKTNQWYLNSGTTCHVTCHRDPLHNYINQQAKASSILLGNNHQCPILRYGTIKATTIVNGHTHKIKLHWVLYAPELTKNLMLTALFAH